MAFVMISDVSWVQLQLLVTLLAYSGLVFALTPLGQFGSLPWQQNAHKNFRKGMKGPRTTAVCESWPPPPSTCPTPSQHLSAPPYCSLCTHISMQVQIKVKWATEIERESEREVKRKGGKEMSAAATIAVVSCLFVCLFVFIVATFLFVSSQVRVNYSSSCVAPFLRSFCIVSTCCMHQLLSIWKTHLQSTRHSLSYPEITQWPLVRSAVIAVELNLLAICWKP